MPDIKNADVIEDMPKVVYEVQSQLASVDEDGHLVRRLAYNLDTADYDEAMDAYVAEAAKHDGRTVMLFFVARIRNSEGHAVPKYALQKVNWARIAPQDEPTVIPAVTEDIFQHGNDVMDQLISQSFERGFLDAVASSWHEGGMGTEEAVNRLNDLVSGDTYSYEDARHVTEDEFVLGVLRNLYDEYESGR